MRGRGRQHRCQVFCCALSQSLGMKQYGKGVEPHQRPQSALLHPIFDSMLPLSRSMQNLLKMVTLAIPLHTSEVRGRAEVAHAVGARVARKVLILLCCMCAEVLDISAKPLCERFTGK